MHVVVIGAGLVGLATGWRLLGARGVSRVTVLEKEPEVGRHQSGHNSGVLHCGLYYKPGSLKARLAVNGIRQMVAFCEEHGVAFERCGKLVVAVDEAEVRRLHELHERGTANGLRGLRWLDAEEARAREPHVAGVAWLEVPEEGIVDYPAVARALARVIEGAGGAVRTSAGVRSIVRDGSGWRIGTTAGTIAADLLVNCAGLHADRVCALAGLVPRARIIPFRGEYYTLRADRRHLVRHLIYPVPDPAFPFLGVHFTRMIHGGVECGPNAVLAGAREGYRWRDVNVTELAGSLAFPGLWRFLAKYPSMVTFEVARSLSRRRFGDSLRRLVPEVRADDLAPGGSGVRAQAMLADGTLLQDFHFEAADRQLHVLNAPSPGATACLAIAEEIVARLAPWGVGPASGWTAA